MISRLKAFTSAIALFSLSISAATASGPTGTVTFQGEAFVIGVTNTCTTSQQAKIGDFFRVVYRFNQSSSLNEALMFLGTRSVFHVYSQTGSLNGATSTTNAVLGSHATFNSGLAGSTNLQISSVGGASIGQALNLKIIGTVDNFYATTGCTVTIRSDLVARPD